MSLRGCDCLLHVDPYGAPGATILERFGADGDLQAEAGDAFYGQHDPELVGGELVLLDNGKLPWRASSRAVAYRLPSGDPAAVGGVAVVTRSYTEAGWFEPVMGGVAALDGGDWLITRAHCSSCAGLDPDARTAFIRVDPDTGAVRWRAERVDPKPMIYRARPVDPCVWASRVDCAGERRKRT